MENSKIAPKYRCRSYAVLLSNLAKETLSKELAEKSVKHSLASGKLNMLYMDQMTIVCTLIENKDNFELCKKMLQDIYYLCRLSLHDSEVEILKLFYQTWIGEPLLLN